MFKRRLAFVLAMGGLYLLLLLSRLVHPPQRQWDRKEIDARVDPIGAMLEAIAEFDLCFIQSTQTEQAITLVEMEWYGVGKPLQGLVIDHQGVIVSFQMG